MIQWFLKKLFGSRNDRALKKIRPLVSRINQLAEEYQKLTDDELKAKTPEFKQRLQNGETTDDIMCEAYATVKDACRRLKGTSVEVTGHVLTWDMVPFDVQIIGGIALHQRNIAEMATGEGKTLVAVMPRYLKALTGRKVELGAVNDYLARRDSEWMGHVLRWLGLTVGCIQNEQTPAERREMYNCDITYGTNSEFGFDYLRDMGMATSKEELVQRDYFYAIIDEIDSILIDEARTPLIIAGPAPKSTHQFDKLKPAVEELYRKQLELMGTFASEAKAILDRDDRTPEEEDDAYTKLALIQLGMPKHKQLMKLMEKPAIRKALERKDAEFHSQNNRGLLQEMKNRLYFAIDEKYNEADLSEKGRQFLRPGDTEAFIIPSLPDIFSQIDADASLDENQKIERRREAQEDFDTKSEVIHNIAQLLRAYCLFEKDVHYVVADNKVVIVDEFTGRPQPGRRFSEGLHQALEAKENVTIERETQTLASITIQNYFRMYEKLAGMTGTAETEANEFKTIYGLDVLVIPTNRPCLRKDYNDRIYKTQREKYKAIIEEIIDCHKRGQPVLVGTISVEVSELLSRILSRSHIVHNVLNARHHEQEAEIVARAGQFGAVTIATNMAGRGTDIKLGPGVKEVGGLHVIGSERHDSRRIDRQLRGRCSRQGDPGSSRFYVSFEDNLMRLFGSDRITSFMERLGLQDGEELEHPFLNKTIENAQRKVEETHFAARERTLEYDNVVNSQRSAIYEQRKNIIMTENPRELVLDYIYTTIVTRCEEIFVSSRKGEAPDLKPLQDWLMQTFPVSIPETTFTDHLDSAESLAKAITAVIEEAYTTQQGPEDNEMTKLIEKKFILLDSLDQLYLEHLDNMDALRQGVQLRSYSGKKPIDEFKQEAFHIYSLLISSINEAVCQNAFRYSAVAIAQHYMEQQLFAMNAQAQASQEALPESATPEPLPPISETSQERERQRAKQQTIHETSADPFAGYDDQGNRIGAPEPQRPGVTIRRETPKVGRNDPCPCGSGKKYKNCCARNLI